MGREQRQTLVDDDTTVHISAAKGINLDGLLETIDRRMQDDPIKTMKLRVPQAEGKVLSTLEAKSKIVTRKYVGGAVVMTVELPESLARRLEKFEK